MKVALHRFSIKPVMLETLQRNIFFLSISNSKILFCFLLNESNTNFFLNESYFVFQTLKFFFCVISKLSNFKELKYFKIL